MNRFCFLFLVSVKMLGAHALPEPYNSLETLLPFDGHGWYSNREQMEELIRSHKIKTVIEVGSWLGQSTRHIASELPPSGKVYAVDHWLGSGVQQEGQPFYYKALPYLYEQFLSNVVHAQLTEKIVPVRMESLAAAHSLQIPVDLIYIDAEHDTDSVYQDLTAWYPHVTGHGVLCGDDWGWPTVEAAVRQFAQERKLGIEASGNFWRLVEPTSIKEKRLIQHVQKSIENAEKGISQLTQEVLALDGMSSSLVRHFLNNIGSLYGASYLEIGSWKGSTLISALFGNRQGMKEAIAIDNWSQFDAPRSLFWENVDSLLGERTFKFYETNCFTLDKNGVFFTPINIYFYDGDHGEESQKRAFTYFNPVFDDVFIAIVDDWNWDYVRRGTEAAFQELKYEILFEKSLFSKQNGDVSSWWNGLYVAVIKKAAGS